VSRCIIAIALAACGSSSTTTSTASGSAPAPVDPGGSAVLDRDAKMFGREPATLGTAFEGIALGRAAKPGDARRIASAIGGVKVELEPGPRGLRAIEIEPVDSTDCRSLRAQVERVWGRPTNEAWLDSKAHGRASFGTTPDHDGCWLRFDAYLEPAAWLAAVPIDMIGADSKALVELVGSGAIATDITLKWTQPGLAFGGVETVIVADLSRGKVAQLVVQVETDTATTNALVALLTRRAGSEPTVVIDADKTTQRTWKTKPPLALHSTANYLRTGNEFVTVFVNLPAT
jgi:hypothetical protein